MITSSIATTNNKPTRDEMARFLKRLRLFVLDETETARQRVQQIWSTPVVERVSRGFAIEGVTIRELQRDGRILLTCQRNSSRFREGDILLLNRGDPFLDPHISVTLDIDRETELLVTATDMTVNYGELARQQTGWLLDEGFLDLSHYVLDALAEAGDTTIGRERILPLLMGRARSAMDATLYERGISLAEACGLNWSQGEALAQAYASDLAYLIQGPPGTGKTRVLAHLAQALVDMGERVLVTSFTHRAINNALNALAHVAPDVPSIKIGQSNRADDLMVENYATFDGTPMADMSSGYAIGATPFATRTSRLQGVEFETVIFDEASQVTLPLAVMGMLAAKRFVFIGDHQQLPPVLVSRMSGPFRDSVFGVLVDRGFDTMLTETYRLSSELVEWPSRHFYGGGLKPANDEVATHRVIYPKPAESMSDILNPDEPKVFVDLRHRNTTTRSLKEASVVVDIVSALFEQGFPLREVGVVAPYRAQGREIRGLLHKALQDSEICNQIVVDTVERMQGQERDLIVVSLTTSNPAFAASLAEFFFQPQRINVAVTRPRKKLIIVGSSRVLDANPDDPELLATVELLRDLIKSCKLCRRA